MGKCINRTYEVHNNIMITEELGAGRVMALCLVCRIIDKYVKIALVRGTACCKNKLCSNSKPSHFKNRLGEVHKGLKIIEDAGNDEVTCKCIKCGHEDKYRKGLVVNKGVLCKNCGEHKTTIVNREGEIHGTFRIDKELGGHKVLCKCLTCNTDNVYIKNNIINKRVICRNCGVPKTTAINRVGQTFYNLTVTEEIGQKQVRCKCTDCGTEDTYLKGSVTLNKVRCRHCSLFEKYNGKIIKEIKILDFAYTGRDGLRYFNCMCIICENIIILNENEIPKYNCDKKQCR